MADTDLVTIVVTDWVDSTGTRSRLGEERADELQRVHDRLLRESIAQHEGTVVKGSGDGVLATFHSATRAIDAGASSFPLPPELSTTGGMRFIGRDDEVQNAIALSTEVEQAHALWVLGEPGIGKTRLATEVAAQAHAAGALVVFGRCDELVSAPFQPVIQALRWHVGNLEDDQLAAALGVDPEALARLAPEIRARLPGISAAVAPTTE